MGLRWRKLSSLAISRLRYECCQCLLRGRYSDEGPGLVNTEWDIDNSEQHTFFFWALGMVNATKTWEVVRMGVRWGSE